MKKTLLLLLCLLLFSLLFSLAVGASTLAEEGAEGVPSEDALTEEEASAPVSRAIGDFLKENADKILCALACLASIVPTLVYKSGLLPLLRSGLSALTEAGSRAGKKAEEFSLLAEEKLADLKTGADAAASAAGAALTVLRETEKRLSALEEALAESVKEKAKTTAALQTETELLFRMLQCINLPQAQKDLMSERYLALQKTLEEA